MCWCCCGSMYLKYYEPHKLARRKEILYSDFMGGKKKVRKCIYSSISSTWANGLEYRSSTWFQESRCVEYLEVHSYFCSCCVRAKDQKTGYHDDSSCENCPAWLLVCVLLLWIFKSWTSARTCSPAPTLLYRAKTGVPKTHSFSFLVVKILFKREKVRRLQENRN